MDQDEFPQVLVTLLSTDGTVLHQTHVRTRPEQRFGKLMRWVCRRMGWSLASHDVVSGGSVLNDCTDEMWRFEIPAGRCLEVRLQPKWINDSF